MHARDTTLHILQRIITTKAHEKLQHDWLKIFLAKVEKMEKQIIMHSYASQYLLIVFF